MPICPDAAHSILDRGGDHRKLAAPLWHALAGRRLSETLYADAALAEPTRAGYLAVFRSLRRRQPKVSAGPFEGCAWRGDPSALRDAEPTRNKTARTTSNATPAEAGAHLSAARAAGRWVPAFAGTAGCARFHPGQVGHTGRWRARNDTLFTVIATPRRPALAGRSGGLQSRRPTYPRPRTGTAA